MEEGLKGYSREVYMKLELFNEDCMEVMSRYPDDYFDLAIVDPPYRDENQPTKDMRANGSMKSLSGRPCAEYFKELCRVSENQIIWGANNFQLPQFMGFVVWEKLSICESFTMSMAEIASLSVGLSTISKIYRQAPQGGKLGRIHPTQKPIKLYEWLLTNYAKPEFKILDTHLGSGSHAIAAHYYGINEFVGCELDEDYFKAASERIDRETAQVDMF